MVPTYLPTSARHLDFNNLVGSYDGGPAGYPELRGWGELGHPSGPVASVPSGSWAAPTSPPSQPHNAEEADRPHEDSKSGVLGAAQWETPTTTHLGSNYEAEMQRYRDMMALGSEGWLHNYLPPPAASANGASESKLAMEGGSGYGTGRPQSSTSLSPPSHLAMPQPINPRGLPNNMLGLNGQRKYQCKMCPQAFHSKADLQLHTQIHLREPKPYKCATCGKAFANSSYLSQHTRIHLGIKPYRCEICQRKFTQLSHLQQHIRTHTGDKPYKCRIPGCTKAFSQLSNLQSHSRCHQTDKPYKCNSCYKCFHDEVSLLEHIPKHKESKHLKTHICSYCGKSYTQETYLAKHMQKHADRTDKRPPIVAEGTSNPTTPMGHLGSPTEHSYWPKMDGYGYGHQLMEQRLPDPREYDPRGLHPGNPHQGLMQEELRHHQHLASASGWGEHGPTSPNPVVPKSSSSAFSPLQSSMLHSAAIHSASPGFGMGNPRGYAAFYDPIAFSSQAPTKVNFGEPSTSTASNTGFAGPQLLSLSKIKNYAHNPHNDGLFKSLSSLSQDKPVHQLGQAAQ